MSKIGKIIPPNLKKLLLKIYYIPDRIKAKIYVLGGQGKIPIPDKLFQKWDYKIFSGKKLSFKNPVSFTEKLQWLKYYYRNPNYTKLVDKYEVRKYVSQKIGEEYLVPIYGVYNSWDEINFDELPDKFVIKCTHDSGGIVICTDKSQLNIDEAKTKINAALSVNHFYKSREWIYKDVKPRIMIEQYIESNNQDLPDYKFFCFDGVMKFLFVATNRQNRTKETNFDFFDDDFQWMDIYNIHPQAEVHPSKPVNFQVMKELAEKLSQGMPVVRVDFYNVDGKIYFGELTFFHGGGRHRFVPESFEKQAGDWITLPPKMR